MTVLERGVFAILWALLAGMASAQRVGDEVCLEGYAMDYYCIQRGTLLDNPGVRTLSAQGPLEHTVHCLLDVPACTSTPFEILLRDRDGGDGFVRAWRLTESAKTQVMEVARRGGSCSAGCTGTQVKGFHFGMRGIVQRPGEGGTPPIVDLIPNWQEEGALRAIDPNTEAFCSGGSAYPMDVVAAMPTWAPTIPPTRSPVGAVEVEAFATSLRVHPEVRIDFEVIPATTEGDPDAIEITVMLDRIAWLAVGSSPGGMMPGTTACIGRADVPDSVLLYDIEARGLSFITPATNQNLLSSSFVQEDGQTILKCKAPVNLQDGFRFLSGERTSSFIVAFGEDNTFGYHGNNRVPSLSVVLGGDQTAVVVAPPPTEAPVVTPTQTPTVAVTAPSQPTEAFLTTLQVHPEVRVDFEVIPDGTNGDEPAAVEITLTVDRFAWAAIGASPTGMMTGTTACIGLADGGEPQLYDIAGRAESLITRSPTQNMLSSSFTQRDGQTILKCRAPLDLDDGFRFFSGARTSAFVVAFGDDNDFGYHGNNRVSQLSVVLGSAQVDADGNPPGGNGDRGTQNGQLGGGDDGDDDEDTGQIEPLLDQQDNGPIELENGLTLVIKDNRDNTATYTLEYEGESWIGLAVSPSGQMVGSQAVIGIPGSERDPEIYNLGAQDVSAVVLSTTQILISPSIIQEGGLTTMTFTVPLDTKGYFISATGDTGYLYAYGSDNELGYHASRRSFLAGLTGSVSLSGDPTGYYKAHGLLMALAWGVLCPLAIGISLCRNHFPSGMFFAVHRGLNTMVVALTLIGFSLAVRATNIENTSHFRLVNHRKIGLVIFLFAVMQAANGYLRPHLPHKPISTEPTEADSEQPNEEQDTPHNKSTLRKAWEISHRVLGFTILVLAWINCTTGIDRFFLKFPDEGDTDVWLSVFWVSAGGIAGLVFAVCSVTTVKNMTE